MKNRLIHETSPYLLQHAENPVDWYPWCDEAFETAKREDKPVFISIGYSTCHWCHVMAHESFENEEIADMLNREFISIKVDREERPDIDSVYMDFCQIFTGGGGWPMTIFATPDRKPFFAGTYFPPETSSRGMMSFRELLLAVSSKWSQSRQSLISSADKLLAGLKPPVRPVGVDHGDLPDAAFGSLAARFDYDDGGFGVAPKFPTPHNILFFMDYYRQTKNSDALYMARMTLEKMFKGGIFDHLGGGFSRYSTDRYWLAPHFEKMLYDNALLIMAYTSGFELTEEERFRYVAVRCADYLITEMLAPEGGFFSAQDADSDGVEGRYYVFSREEILTVLGNAGAAFCQNYDVTDVGNFDGKNILNLISGGKPTGFEKECETLLEYRKNRTKLHTDDKLLASWNCIAISAFAMLGTVVQEPKYTEAAINAINFIERGISESGELFVSYRGGKYQGHALLDDYAWYVMALLSLHRATHNGEYLERAETVCNKVLREYADKSGGGFFMNGANNEKLIRPVKETYDGAIPSGNSVMCGNLVALANITDSEKWHKAAKDQVDFMSVSVHQVPAGHCFFMDALLNWREPPMKVTVVLAGADGAAATGKLPWNCIVTILEKPTDEYKLLNGEDTFYICRNHTCSPPVNDPNDLSEVLI